MIGLLREAGGLGDIICIGAAARRLKDEMPNEQIALCVPFEFKEVGEHLEGIDRVISLGPLSSIVKNRRPRDAEMDANKYPYLVPAMKLCDSLIDLWCPGYLHENTCSKQIIHSRPQLFAIAAGIHKTSEAIPVWNVTEDEREQTKSYAKLSGYGRPLIAVQVRATCDARSLSREFATTLLTKLPTNSTLLLFDSVQLRCSYPRNAHPQIAKSLSFVAALIEQCDLVLTVDSFLWHLSAAVKTPATGLFGPTDGKVSSQTYPLHSALDGVSEACPIACNYNREKKWGKSCRTIGCDRLKSHTIESVCAHVRQRLEEKEESSERSEDIEKGV